jgi:hypothetical protein
MSHFTRLKTSLVHEEYLKRALLDLGYQVKERTFVRGYAGRRTEAHLVIPSQNPDYDVGFQKVGETFECVADWYGVRGIRREAFLQRVTQRYAYHAARAKLEEQGFAVAHEETTKDGQIHLVLRRTA